MVEQVEPEQSVFGRRMGRERKLTFWLVFAQQGYFVVAINPTGSTSFGQELTNAIKEDWGGKPFVGQCSFCRIWPHPCLNGRRRFAEGMEIRPR